MHDHKPLCFRQTEISRQLRCKFLSGHTQFTFRPLLLFGLFILLQLAYFDHQSLFFAFPDHTELDGIVEKVVSGKAEYDFTSDDGVGHHFWLVNDSTLVNRIIEIFENDIEATYVADGHHRTAAAALVGQERKKLNPDHKGDEEYNFFLAVHFPASQLTIIDYNRVVKDLNGHTSEEFLRELEEGFIVKETGRDPFRPDQLHKFGMYLEGKWYSLDAKPGTYNDDDPIGCLDVTVLSEQVLGPLLNITDLRKSKRIDFVGGIRGLEELSRRVDSGEMAVAFALYPVTMKQLMDIADNGMIMPPKTTWFEPKLRSGLVIQSLE